MMRFVRYLMVQLVGYGLDMGSFILLISYFAVDPIPANIVGRLLSGVFAFFIHRRFTFSEADRDRKVQQAVRYFTLMVVNLPISSLILSATLWLIPMATAAKFVADVMGIFLTYWLTKRFVFLGGGAKKNTSDSSENSGSSQ